MMVLVCCLALLYRYAYEDLSYKCDWKRSISWDPTKLLTLFLFLTYCAHVRSISIQLNRNLGSLPVKGLQRPPLPTHSHDLWGSWLFMAYLNLVLDTYWKGANARECNLHPTKKAFGNLPVKHLRGHLSPLILNICESPSCMVTTSQTFRTYVNLVLDT